MPPKDREYNIIVVGGGPLGAISALALGKSKPDVNIKWVKGAPRPSSQRSVAVMKPGIDFISNLTNGDFPDQSGFPLDGLRLVDVCNNLLAAPETLFLSSEIDMPYFALALNDNQIAEELSKTIARISNIQIIEQKIKSSSANNDGIVATLDDGVEIDSLCLIAADGKYSACRDFAQIPYRLEHLNQVALTTTLECTGNHQNISTEFHTKNGPFTFVPNGPGKVNLVSMLPDRLAQGYVQNEGDFKSWVNKQSLGLLGRLTLRRKPQVIDLHKLSVETLYKSRVFLVGDSAHSFPPIGAQGFNLGLRDVIALVSLFNDAKLDSQTSIDDIGQKYCSKRLADIKLRTQAVMGLNQSLLSGIMPISPIRAAGLGLMKTFPSFKKKVMQAGMGDWG